MRRQLNDISNTGPIDRFPQSAKVVGIPIVRNMKAKDKISVIKGQFKGRVFKVLSISDINIHGTPKLEYIKVDAGKGTGKKFILETWVIKCM